MGCEAQWNAEPRLRQGVTTRGDEVALNLSFTVTDDNERVVANRMQVAQAFGFSFDALVIPQQTHGIGVAVVASESAGRGATALEAGIPETDALVTDVPGLLLGVTIADCLPVFFYDPERPAIGIAHSGWRGAAGGIAERTLETMQAQFGTRPERCRAAIGPGIDGAGYEVCEKVYGAFPAAERTMPGVFVSSRPNHWNLDLTRCVEGQLLRAGVRPERISISPWRTNRDTELFFSHRRQPNCPRMGAFIGLLGHPA
jgi:hypothetical protein